MELYVKGGGGVYKYSIKWTITSSRFSDIKYYMANQI
jgi:hypothetical protein